MVIDRMKGTVTWPATGDVFEGALDDRCVPDGPGRLTYAASGDVFEGDFVNGLRHGKGAYHHASGVVTVGTFVRDRLTGTGLRWSADRRRAWALSEGVTDMQYKKVAPVDENTTALGLQWHGSEHGAVPLEIAWRLAAANGLAPLAAAIGAQRADPVNETDFMPGAPNHIVPGQPFTSAQRQAAYMMPGLRPTVHTPAPADVWPWPLARGEPPFGEEPPSRILIERSIFTKPSAAAGAYAERVATGSLPAGKANRAALTQSIRDDMEPWRSELRKRYVAMGSADNAADAATVAPPPLSGGARPSWLTPGESAPLLPTPHVPSAA